MLFSSVFLFFKKDVSCPPYFNRSSDLELEEDLANNNDPNNNPANDLNQPEAEAEAEAGPLNPEPPHQGPEADQNHDLLVSPLVVNPPPPPSSHYVEPEFEAAAYQVDRERLAPNPQQVKLDRDVELICKLMPSRTYEEVQTYLEAHIDKPSRVEVSFPSKANATMEELKGNAPTGPIFLQIRALWENYICKIIYLRMSEILAGFSARDESFTN